MEAENNSMNEAQEADVTVRTCRKVPWAWIALVAVVAILAVGAGWMIGQAGRSSARQSASLTSSSREDRDRDETRSSRESANSAQDGHSRSQFKIEKATTEAQQLTEAILAYELFGTSSPLKNKVTGETWQEATEDNLNFVLGKERNPNGQNGFMPVLYNGPLRDGKICDPWGRAYRYRIMPSAGNANVSYVVGVWSLGPDGEPNSDDDICTWPDSKRGADEKAVAH